MAMKVADKSFHPPPILFEFTSGHKYLSEALRLRLRLLLVLQSSSSRTHKGCSWSWIRIRASIVSGQRTKNCKLGAVWDSLKIRFCCLLPGIHFWPTYSKRLTDRLLTLRLLLDIQTTQAQNYSLQPCQSRPSISRQTTTTGAGTENIHSTSRHSSYFVNPLMQTLSFRLLSAGAESENWMSELSSMHKSHS